MLRLVTLPVLALLAACASTERGVRASGREPNPVPVAAAALEPSAPEPDAARASAAAIPAPRDDASAESAPAADASREPSPEPSSFDPLEATRSAPASAWDFYRDRYDADHDGRVTRAEYTRSELGFQHLDANGDGVVSAEDFARRFDGVPRVGTKKKFDYGQGGPRFGEAAPGFTLKSTSGDEIDLEQFRGHRPVVLVFGSFT